MCYSSHAISAMDDSDKFGFLQEYLEDDGDYDPIFLTQRTPEHVPEISGGNDSDFDELLNIGMDCSTW